MNEMMTSGTEFNWGWIIFLILILWFFVGGNGFFGNGFGRGYGYGNGFIAGDVLGQLQGRDASLNCGASNCEVERRAIVEAAETNYRIIDQAQQTRNAVEAASAVTNNKIDFYAYQDLRDKLAESQRENMMLQNKLYSDAKFGAIEAQLASISCRMAKQPEVYATSAVCPNAAIINGLGFNGFSYPYSCGCNGNVLA